MWRWLMPPQPFWTTGDGSKGDRRRDELTCPGHTQDYGHHITGMTVRWYCKCGAYRDEVDAPPPHGNDQPSGDYLEMEVRGLRGQKGPWRSQVTDKPLPTKRTVSPEVTTAPAAASSADTPTADRSTQAGAPGSTHTTSTSTGGTGMSGIEDVVAAVAQARENSEQILAALALIQQWSEGAAGGLTTALGGSSQDEVQHSIAAFSQTTQLATEMHQLVAGAIEQVEQYRNRL
ncbi:hypothetical protein [Saccharopolyspora cebuensis]|uniref:WXG100 family type VII secretion target n=2 Tax=Saccharopolyspora cebuensis TaxID=418759 RepID=A0ABV4CJ43_9PSEU